ncbi:MAG TPA: phytoene/squalene synthase family protein [Chthoniobacterales bacterium]|nr:phytoene/squalene synthase family protein [Chthoniobacterales bacterium]
MQLSGAILRSVSRSFYLSIRMLPRAMRDPVALAYLLARATDTIADTTDVDAASRMQHLARLAEIIQTREPSESAVALRNAIAPLQTNASERALIEALPQCIAWLRASDAADRADIQRVLALINRGQALDVERFGNPHRVVALETAAELDEYTYLVAGCVGEFWTTVSFRKLARFADRSREEMIALGVRYGKALQLINILRDIGDDARVGRCHLPEEQLRSTGIAPGEIGSGPAAVAAVLKPWQHQADEGLEAGIEYACAIRSPRVRLATALPALIGARTLALLRAAGATAVPQTVKVPRSEVRRILLTTTVSLASPGALRRSFVRCSGGL